VVCKNKFLITMTISYFHVGVQFLFFPGGHRAKIQAAKIERMSSQAQIELNKTRLKANYKIYWQEYYKLQVLLDY